MLNRPTGDKLILMLDHEATVADSADGSHLSIVNPMGAAETLWTPVSSDDLTELHKRTTAYGDDLVAAENTRQLP